MTAKKDNKDNRRSIAQVLFMQGYPQKEIACMVEASEVSISRWAKAGNWEEIRKRSLNSKPQVLSSLYDELAELNRSIKEKTGYKVADSKEADIRRKLIRDISELESKYNIAQTTTIARDFVMHVRRDDPQLAEVVMSHFDTFIQDLVKKAIWHD